MTVTSKFGCIVPIMDKMAAWIMRSDDDLNALASEMGLLKAAEKDHSNPESHTDERSPPIGALPESNSTSLMPEPPNLDPHSDSQQASALAKASKKKKRKAPQL